MTVREYLNNVSPDHDIDIEYEEGGFIAFQGCAGELTEADNDPFLDCEVRNRRFFFGKIDCITLLI